MVPRVNFVVVAPAVQFTWEARAGFALGRKFVPVNEILTGIVAAPATAVFGVMLVRVGSGFGGGLMTNATGFERPLRPAPVVGLRVMTVATPDLVTKVAGTFAVAMLPSMFPALSVGRVVSRVCPFHCATVPFTNVPPFRVSTKSGLPALMTDGEIDVIVAPVLF
jgi:hypothetical protein